MLRQKLKCVLVQLELSILNQQQDRHGEAVDIFKRGVHLARINNGLYCTEQVPLLQGEILTPTKLFHAGQVAVDAQGSITCVGCDCAQGGETIISCPDASISPGLINTHDHITFTQNAPYTEDPAIRYDHRHPWRKGQDGKPKISAAGGASADQIQWGELRFLMGGATSIVGSGGQTGLLRNLDSAQQEGLAQRAVNFLVEIAQQLEGFWAEGHARRCTEVGFKRR